MALENVLERLARAIESQAEACAVAELIRQRDVFATSLETMTRDRDWYKNRMNELGDEKRLCERRIAALQGVITRMKRKAVK
jgi:hypothetical protein